MIARRALLLSQLASPALAQHQPRPVGALALTDRAGELLRAHLLPELARRGWHEGRNLVLDLRVAPAYAQGEAAMAMVRAAPHAIVAVSGPAVRAAREATTTIPILMHGADSRLLAGTSMARPGGNATGVVANSPEAEAKRVEIATELTPAGTPLGAIFPYGTDTLAERLTSMQVAAAGAGRALVVEEWAGTADVTRAVTTLAAQGVRGVALGGTPEALRDAALIASEASAAQMATIGQWRSMVDAGCTASHGPNFHALYVRLAHFLALILRGVPVGDLPIEAPMRVETTIDLRAVQAMGLSVPVSLLARADEVLE